MESLKIAALIPAAGEGSRLGRGPKAFVELAGKSLLLRSVEAFQDEVAEVVVAVSPTMLDEAQQRLSGRARVIVGGETRQKSVHRLLLSSDADMVLIHDAARPFVSRVIIKDLISRVQQSGAASVAMPVADTLIEAKSGKVVARELLRAVQTPQGFRRSLILKAQEYALKQQLTATDDAGLVRLLGHEVSLVAGSSWLMKVTTPADFEMATALAFLWDERAN